MKICMPVLAAEGGNSQMFGHFGSAPCFALFDSDDRSVRFVANGVGAHEHGQCMPVDAIKNTGAEAVLCRGMGLREANLLIAAGIRPYMVEAETVDEAVRKFLSNEVALLDEGRACQHHGCH